MSPYKVIRRTLLGRNGLGFATRIKLSLDGVLIGGSRLKLGRHVHIGDGSIIGAVKADVVLHDHAMLGPRVSIMSAAHEPHGDNHNMRYGSGRPGRVVVGPWAWLGVNVVVMPGVTIGEGAVVGANAVVTHDIPSYSIACGAPARVIGKRRNAG